MLMSTAVAIQNETFCCFCKSNYNRAIREMKVRSQRHCQNLLQRHLPFGPLKSGLYNKKIGRLLERSNGTDMG